MKTLIIPGYSTKNKDWAYEVKKELQGFDINIYEWKHWSDPNIKFSARDEAKNIKNIVGEESINIIAKSVGTLVISLAIAKEKLNVNKIIFCGIPINDISDDEKGEYRILSDIPSEKVIVFQNSEDEHGSFESLRRFLSQINPNIEIKETPGSTHNYPYFDKFEEFLR